MNIPSAIFTSLRSNPLFHTKNAAMPMRTNSVVHTGPNIQDGGFNAGLVIPAYQVWIDGAVKTEPMIPADSETIIAKMSLKVLFILIIMPNNI